jgi:Mn-dependent DtxR family transcriptional regulator
MIAEKLDESHSSLFKSLYELSNNKTYRARKELAKQLDVSSLSKSKK